MPWMTFSKRFSFRPTPISIVTYEAGMTRLVTTPCAEAAKAAGAAVAADRPAEETSAPTPSPAPPAAEKPTAKATKRRLMRG